MPGEVRAEKQVLRPTTSLNDTGRVKGALADSRGRRKCQRCEHLGPDACSHCPDV